MVAQCGAIANGHSTRAKGCTHGLERGGQRACVGVGGRDRGDVVQVERLDQRPQGEGLVDIGSRGAEEVRVPAGNARQRQCLSREGQKECKAKAVP